jgi:hypothetical protein|tara:strand:- start:276 stop:509 length:234 start_codon:yes stop_codon:yes gene_type:complete
MAFKMRKFSGFKQVEPKKFEDMSVQEFLSAAKQAKEARIERRKQRIQNVIQNPDNYSERKVRRNIQKFRKDKSRGRY